jgi:hypothetical protein
LSEERIISLFTEREREKKRKKKTQRKTKRKSKIKREKETESAVHLTVYLITYYYVLSLGEELFPVGKANGHMDRFVCTCESL